jgi:hypothetical protein
LHQPPSYDTLLCANNDEKKYIASSLVNIYADS